MRALILDIGSVFADLTPTFQQACEKTVRHFDDYTVEHGRIVAIGTLFLQKSTQYMIENVNELESLL